MNNQPKPQQSVNCVMKRAFVAAQLLLVLTAGAFCYADEEIETPEEVQDLRYGVVLYHFYQQSYFDALTEALVGEERADMPFHGDSAKLLRGGMSLSYGMGGKAEQIFNELLDTLGKDDQKNRAWFYLGKLHYLQNNNDAARQAFSRIEAGELDSMLLDEFTYLSANLFLRAGQPGQADETIKELDDDSPWLAYYHFNRGAQQARNGDWQKGVESFNLIGQSALDDYEGLILKDRANIASGFAYLGGGEYDKAVKSFVDVRLDSPLSDKALLGYGWAAAQKNDYRTALAPWQALSKRPVLNASVQEGLLAIPFAYEKLDAPASALQEYINAALVFEKELATIKEAVALFRDGPVAEILDEQPLGSDWIGGEDYLPLNKQAPYLAHLIAQDHFQAAIADRNDLTRMANFLKQSKERFAALRNVLDLQQQNWQASLDNALREKHRERYQQLLATRGALRAKMAQAEETQDGRVLVDAEESALWNRVEQAEKRVALLNQGGIDVSEEQEALRLYRGMLAWRASENYSIGKWEIKKQFAEVDKWVTDTEDKLQRIESMSPERFDVAFSDRLTALQQRIDQQAEKVDSALLESETNIRVLAVEELLKQQQRLSLYLGQAKLSIARLYDLGSASAETE